MSGATVSDFLAYWENEGDAYVRRGDYAWMAGLVPGRRVLDFPSSESHFASARHCPAAPSHGTRPDCRNTRPTAATQQ